MNEDGPVVRMMLGVVESQIRTSMERFGGTGPDFIVFPDYVKQALQEEIGGPEGLPEKLEMMGVKIEWKEE